MRYIVEYFDDNIQRKMNSSNLIIIDERVELNCQRKFAHFILDELHAKLVYAEALLIRALLTFIQDQGLFSFISGALKIKECHDLFM